MLGEIIPISGAGAGGRHRQTLSYGQSPDLSLLPRRVIAREVQDVRSLYHRESIHTKTIRHGLRSRVQLNKPTWVGVFEK